MNVKYRLSKLQSELKYLKDYEGQLRNEYFSFRKRGLLHVFNVSNSSIALGMVRKDYKNAYFVTCIAFFLLCILLENIVWLFMPDLWDLVSFRFLCLRMRLLSVLVLLL